MNERPLLHDSSTSWQASVCHERPSGKEGFLATFEHLEERPNSRIKQVAMSRGADEQELLPLWLGDESLHYVAV